MNLIPKNLSQLRRIALAVLLASFAILETTSISAQELGRTITSPFGVANPYMNASDASESGSEGDTFVDPETGEVGHIIRNPFGVANPEGVDTGIDIPDSGEEEVGGIITNPFGTPSPDGVDTGVDVFDEDEEYLISLPDEETDVDEREPVEDEGNADDTLDDAKELEEELAEATTEKYVPVKDNPIPGRECDTIDFSIVGTCGSDSVTSSTELPDQIPTLRVPSGESFTIHAETLGNFLSGNPTWTISSGSISPCLLSGATNLSTQIIPAGDGPHSFQTTGILWARYSISATAVAGESSCTRILNVEIYSIDLRIDSDNNGVINDLDEVRETNNPGKIIGINNLDINADEIPDFADGFDCTNGGISGAGRSASFTKMELIIPRSLSNSNYSNYSVKFTYDESLYSVERQETHTATIPYCYKPPTEGKLRIWTKDGGEARLKGKVTDFVPGHRVPKNEPIPLNKLFSGNVTYSNTRTVTLYVEAINPSSSSGGNTIAATLCYAETELTKTRDSVKTTAVKVDYVTPKKGRDNKKAIKILIETNQTMDNLTGEVYRYYTPAQTEDRKVNITAKVTPAIKDVPVYFEVIDPDDLSPYEGKTYNAQDKLTVGNEDLLANDNQDPNKSIIYEPPQTTSRMISVTVQEEEAEEKKDSIKDLSEQEQAASQKMASIGEEVVLPPRDYANFQKCLSSRSVKTDTNGEAKIILTITDQYSGDNYIVRASCINPDITQNEPRAFDKYSLEPPPTPPSTPTNGMDSLSEEDINGILNSLQYEDKTTIAQTALLVAWKRTYIEHANMYKNGATVIEEASAGSREIKVDNTDDFNIGDRIEFFLPEFENVPIPTITLHVLSKNADTISLDAAIPWIIPIYAGVRKIPRSTATYSNDTSFLVYAFGCDAGGVDGGAFIEFKELELKVHGIVFPHNVPKYANFLYPDDSHIYRFADAWFIYKNLVNTNVMILVAAKKNDDDFGLAYDTRREAFVFNNRLSDPGGYTPERANQIRDTTAHELGHIWQILPDESDEFKHVDRGDSEYKGNHLNSDECIMNYNRNRYDDTVEFCLDCLYKLRKQKCIPSPLF